MTYIELSGKKGKGRRTLVDDSTFKKYGHLTWHLSDTGYVVRRNRSEGGTVRLHRLVAGTPEGMFTDHKNHDRLDNRKSNLRIVTQEENMANYKGAKGYVWDKSKNKWMVRYKNQFHGRYATEAEAKRAYQLARSGVPYKKTRRKFWNLPPGVTKQFGKYRVYPRKNGIRYWLGAYTTVDEAVAVLKAWKERG